MSCLAVTGETTGRQCWEVQTDCCLTTKKQFGQLGDSEQCCALSTQFTHPLTHTHTHNTQEYKPGDTKYSAKPANLRLKAPRNLSPKQVTEMEALLGCWNPCNSEAHNSGAARIVMGPYLALLAAQAELRALLGGAGPSQGSGEGEEEEEEQEHAKAAEGAQGGGAPGEGAAGAGGGRRGSRKRAATDFLKPSGSKKQLRR